MNGGQEAARALLQVGALKFDSAEPFVYASHKIGPVYVDARQLSSDPACWALIVNQLAALVEEKVGSGSFDQISGGEVADLLFSIPVAMKLMKPHLTIRKTPKAHGLGGRLVGRLVRGQRVVHIADMITAGTSAADWVGVIRAEGGVVEDYFSVFDRGQGGAEALQAMGVRVTALLRLDRAFVEAAVELGYLGQREASGILAYLDDPDGWARKFLREEPEVLERHVSVSDGKLVGREGVDVLAVGYPELKDELGPALLESLRRKGLALAIPELGQTK